MTKQTEALKLALDWLEGGNFVYPTELRTAIKEALAQPEQKLWLGLTEEEIKECFKVTPDMHLPWHIYTRIEAKLKEKNT
jgi:hypothetical protein